MEDIKRIYKIMLKHWGLMISGLFTMTFYALFGGVSVMMAIPLFDYVFNAKENIVIKTFSSFFDAVFTAFSDKVSFISFSSIYQSDTYDKFLLEVEEILKVTDPLLLLELIAISMIVLITLKNIFYYANRIIFINLRGKTVLEIREFIYQKYLYQSFSFLNQNRVGDSLVRIFSDVQIVNNMLIGSLFNSLRDLITIFVYATMALLINPKLFLISLTIVPIFTFFVNLIGNKVKKYAKRIQRESSNMFSSIEEVLNGIKIVKSFSKEEMEFSKFQKINRNFFRFWRKSQSYGAVNVPLSEFNGVATGVLMLLLGGNIIFSGDSNLTQGQFFGFMFAIFSMLHPMKTISKAFQDIKKAKVSLGRISEIINRESEVIEAENAIVKKGFESDIHFNNITFAYDINNREEATALKNVSFSIKRGEQIALVGSSGSGKTTLTNLLTRMYDVTEGNITIDGIDIKDMSLTSLRSLFGTVTQESILFNKTVKENIAYGINKNDVNVEDKVIKAAKIAYADEFIEKLPKKYDEMLVIKANNLSGGQKQRLCIARAIVGNPPILIFDEATSALDTESERKVQIAIEQATEDKTVIVIAHRLSTILSSDKIVVFDDGKIVGIGTNSELLKSCEKYKLLYDLQFGT